MRKARPFRLEELEKKQQTERKEPLAGTERVPVFTEKGGRSMRGRKKIRKTDEGPSQVKKKRIIAEKRGTNVRQLLGCNRATLSVPVGGRAGRISRAMPEKGKQMGLPSHMPPTAQART